MSTALDGPIGKVAAQLVAKFGKAATLVMVTAVPNGAAGTVTESRQEYPVKCIPTRYSARLVNDTTIKQGDWKITIAARALTQAPDTARTADDGSRISWEIKLDSVTFRVINVEPTYSGEGVAIYDLQARR